MVLLTAGVGDPDPPYIQEPGAREDGVRQLDRLRERGDGREEDSAARHLDRNARAEHSFRRQHGCHQCGKERLLLQQAQRDPRSRAGGCIPFRLQEQDGPSGRDDIRPDVDGEQTDQDGCHRGRRRHPKRCAGKGREHEHPAARLRPVHEPTIQQQGAAPQRCELPYGRRRMDGSPLTGDQTAPAEQTRHHRSTHLLANRQHSVAARPPRTLRGMLQLYQEEKIHQGTKKVSSSNRLDKPT